MTNKLQNGDWVKLLYPARFDKVPCLSIGKIIKAGEDKCTVEFALDTVEVNTMIMRGADKVSCSPKNVPLFLDWINNRGGIAVWTSVNLSDPARTFSRPLNDLNDKPLPKTGTCGDIIQLARTVEDVEVFVPREVKRFHVAVRVGSQGLSLKVTDGGTRRLRAEVDKAVEKYGTAWYVFDYGSYENAVIMTNDTLTPLSEWEVVAFHRPTQKYYHGS